MAHAELKEKDLRKTIAKDSLGIVECTDELKPTQAIVGQKRATDALQFGLDIQSKGFNIYVAGPPGIGKMTTAKALLEKVARRRNSPSDWCYVNNFEDAYRPRALKLPAGRGNELKKDMKVLIEDVHREVPKIFQSDRYSKEYEAVLGKFRKKREELQQNFKEKAQNEGFTLQSSPFGLAIVPAKDGKPMEESDLQSLPGEEREKLENRGKQLRKEMESMMKALRRIDRSAEEKLKELDKKTGMNAVNDLIEDMLDKYLGLPEVKEYLETVKKDIAENIDSFKQHPSEKKEQSAGLPFGGQQPQEENSLRKYEVNVIVDNGNLEGAPVVLELNPTYNHLFGRVEKEAKFGALQTDFTMIKPGALHRANGGFLVLSMEDVLRNVMSWEGLKRTLQSGELQIEELGERLGFMATKTLRPEPIPIDLKVVVTGRSLWHLLLQAYDKDFGELFKVKADFSSRMDRTAKNLREFVSFICAFCEKEELKHMDREGAARLAEHASRLTEDQKKLSTHFGAVVDIIRESNFWAEKDKSPRIGKKHVEKTIEQKIYRSNLVEEQVREMIERGALKVDTEGEAAAQVNGLSIVNLGDYQFGKPARITASVGAGKGGIVDIEREANLGGPVHSKGVLILSGYLQQKYGQNNPLALAGRVVFEQSYQGVEGDSASSAELYCIISALAEAPVKQGIAVTGSVNQHGDVQAIGGVNQKIEGFFSVCKIKGLTGGQGVIIPQSNVQNLMLKDEVVSAVKKGKFHIWPVKKIDEGMEILTGLKAGKRKKDGTFSKNSFNFMVERKLSIFAEQLKHSRQEE